MSDLRRVYFKKDTIYHNRHCDKNTKHFLIGYSDSQMANLRCERPDGHYSITVPVSSFDVEENGIFVKVIQYTGGGSFLTNRFSTYLCNGSRNICLDGCSHGLSSKKEAMDVATLYGDLLVAPIKFYIES